MAVLSDRSILEEIDEGSLRIRPFNRDALQPATYDLRIYWKVLVSPTRYNRGGRLDLRKEPEQTFGVEPGRFVGALSDETLSMPLNISARFGLRSEFTRRGLVAFGGIQIDPGFRGRLAISLFNAGPEPIELVFQRKMFTVEFDYLSSPALGPYKGEYQNQRSFPKDQESFILHAHTVSLAEINHLPVELARLRQRILTYEARALPGAQRQTLSELALIQGIRPVDDPKELTGGWPKDEDVDAFIRMATADEITRMATADGLGR